MNGLEVVLAFAAIGALIAIAVRVWPERDEEFAGVDEWQELQERLRPRWWRP